MQPPLAQGAPRAAEAHIGFVFQSYHLLDDLTVAENLDLPLSLPRRAKAGAAGASWPTRWTASRSWARRTSTRSQLSGGQQQLVGVARAIIAKPKLILADEPTGNLHSDQGREIMELFRRLNDGGHHDHPGHALRGERRLRPARIVQPARRLDGERTEAPAQAPLGRER